MEGAFRLSHASATTEKAVEAAARVEEIVGAVVNGNRRAWGQIDAEDIALLVQHARDAAAEQRAEAAEARAAQAEAKADRLRALLSTGLEIVDSLSAGYDVWAEQVRAAVEPGAA